MSIRTLNDGSRRLVRGFMATVVVGLWLSLAGSVLAIDHSRPAYEPYELAGQRMVFTTWYWVRPGQWDWQNDDGESVFANSDKAGPFDCHYKLIDGPRGIRIVTEPARRQGPIIKTDKPWEAMGAFVTMLMWDEDKFRMWGGCQDAEGTRYNCLFESTDGKNWTRPNLGIVEYAGSKDNNLMPALYGCPFKDPIAPPGERYKMAYHGDCDKDRWPAYKERRPWSVLATEADPGRVHSIRGAVSPDGIRWTVLPDPISVEVGDTQIIVYYDELLQKYVMYPRNYMYGRRAPGQPRPDGRWHEFVARRSIGRSETENFREFPLSEVIIEPGPELMPTDSYYTNCRTSIPKAQDHHLMFPAVFHQDRDTTSIELWSSWDGRIWHKLSASPVFGTSTFGQWDGGCVFATPNLIELDDGSWVLPYTGYVYPHKYPRGAWKYDIGYAVWPKGRMIALEAPLRGEFTTVLFLAEGETLKINAVTERAGHILIEVAGLDGKPIAGRSFDEAKPIIGDQFWSTVTWKDYSNLGVKKGEPIMLRVQMDKAKIYGFEFE